MPHESVSIFDSRYERVERNELRRRQPRELLTTCGELIAEVEKLCDELAQAKQALALHAEIKALHKERIEEQAGSLRVFSRMIGEALDNSTAKGSACSPEAAGDSFESPAQSLARSSAAEQAITPAATEPAGEDAGSSPAGPTLFSIAYQGGEDIYCARATREEAECAGRFISRAEGRAVTVRPA